MFDQTVVYKYEKTSKTEITKTESKNLLLKFSTFAKFKNIKIDMVNQLRETNLIDTVKYEKSEYVIMNDKAKNNTKNK